MRPDAEGTVVGEPRSQTVPDRLHVGPWWAVFLVGAVLSYLAGLVVSYGHAEYPAWFHYGWIRLGCCLVGAVAVAVAAVVLRPSARAPWFFLSLMCLGYAFRPIDDLFLGGGANWTGQGRYVLLYVVLEAVGLCVALALFVRHRRRARAGATMLEIAGLLCVFLAYELHAAIIPPWSLLSFDQAFQIAMALVVPVGRALALTLLLVLLLGDRIPGASFRMLAIGLACTVLPNAIGPALPRDLDNAVWGVLVDAVPLLTLLTAAAAWHPTMRRLTEPAPTQVDPGLSLGRLLLIGALLFLPVVGLLTGQPPALGEVVAIVALLGAGTFILLFRSRLAVKAQQAAERRSYHRAVTDALTGLYNRVGLVERMRDSRQPLGVLVVDLERFKSLNDVHGPAAGDRILQLVADRIRAAAPRRVIARLGGDDFAVAFDDPGDLVAIGDRLAADLHQALTRPLDLDGIVLHLGVSIGLAAGLGSDESFQETLGRAAIACKGAAGRPELAAIWFTDRMDVDQHRSTAILEELRSAEPGIHLHYQAQVRLSDGLPIGAEALARMTHPTLGPVGPAEFVPLAEHNGLILPLGRLVIDQVVAELTLLLDRLPQDFTVSINLSPIQLDTEREHGPVPQLLAVDPAVRQHLAVEITESALAGELARAAVRELSAAGYRISLDDFGTAYSSLQFLSTLPVDELKLDRSFVAAMDRSTTDRVMVRQLIALARALSLSVVAEGVEERSQAQELHAMSCDIGQGYLWDRPAAGLGRVIDIIGTFDPTAQPTGAPPGEVVLPTQSTTISPISPHS